MVRIVGKYDVTYMDLKKIKSQNFGKKYLISFLNGNPENYRSSILNISTLSKYRVLEDYELGKIFVVADDSFSPALNYKKEKNSKIGHYVLNSTKHLSSIFFNSGLNYLIRTLKPQYSGEVISIVEPKVEISESEDIIKDEKKVEEITALYFSYNKPPKPKIHKVKEDENLSSIAKQYGTTYEEIASLNKISNPHLIFPEQTLIIPQENKKSGLDSIKLNGTFIPLGTEVNVVAHGTKGARAKIEILSDNKKFEFIKDGQGVTYFYVKFDQNGQSVTPVTLRPQNTNAYPPIINRFTPSIGSPIKEEKLTLKGEIKEENYQSSLETDDMNTIGLLHYQTYIQNAYITDSSTGQVKAKLTAKQQGSDIIFLDEENQPVASTSLDNITNTFGNINNGLGGLTKGMQKVDGTFALANSKGVNLKHYEGGWAGNQYVKTYSMSKWAGRISNGTFVISVVIGAVQINSAYEKDTSNLNTQGIKKENTIDGIGQYTERQVASTALGFAGGAISGLIIGVIAIPASGIFIALGVSIVVGGVVGWALSEAGSEGVELIQERKGSTIINDYKLY